MGQTLQESLLNPTNRPQVVKDCAQLVDEQVKDSGLLVKGAYKVVTAFKSDIIPDAVDTLVDDFVARLEPFHEDFVSAGGGSFGDYLAGRGPEVSNALLGVTDDRAAQSDRATLRKAYEQVRPKGQDNIEKALPKLGKIVEKYTV
jgi:hypothetical protein